MTINQMRILVHLKNNPQINHTDSIHYTLFGRPKTGKGYKYSKVTNSTKGLIKDGYINAIYEKLSVSHDRMYFLTKKAKKLLAKSIDSD